MAIKKGAFELYTQERKLPEKRVKSPAKASHFFDDIYTKDNGSQSVHEQSLIQQTVPAGSPPAHANSILNNITSNGSQSVHEQSLIQQTVPAGSPSAHANSVLNNNTSNGSQSVHEQSLIQQTVPVGSPSAHANSALNNDTSNGSQSVHVKGNDLASKTVDAQVSVLEKNPQISFSKLVGNQRAIIIALYKNIKINKSDTTDELTLESISKLTQVNQKSLKNTLFRLNNAGILIRADQKVGRGGWVKYKINTHIIREIQQKEFFR